MYIPTCFSRFIAAASFLIMLNSCLMKDFSEQDAVLSVDTDRIEVPGDLVSGEAVASVLTVTSNRSCSVDVVPKVDWVSVDVTEHEDLAGVSQDIPLGLTFLDNASGTTRTANLVITTSEALQVVKLVQRPLSPRLQLGSQEEFAPVHYEGGEVVIDVNANVSWTAAVADQSSNADVDLELTDTDRNGSVKLSFGENFDLEQEAYAVLSLSAEGFEPLSVTVRQQKAQAYARITGVDGGEEILPATGGTRFLYLKSNVDWTLAVKDDAADNLTFSSTSGRRGESKIKMTFAGNPEFDSRRDFTVQFLTSVPGIDDGSNEHTFVQERGSLLRFVFSFEGTWYWPFTISRPSLSTGSPSWGGVATLLETYSGSNITIFSNYGIWLNNTRGLNVGRKGNGSVGDYIQLPVIEGRRLSRLTWQASGGGSRNGFQIVSADDPSVIVGEEMFSVVQAGDIRVWELTATKASKAYRIVSVRDDVMQTPAFECYYE